MDKTVGVLGGGQLGRMLAEAANRLNITLIILDKASAPAKQITAHNAHITGSFKDGPSIHELTKKSDVLTIEIEHVDADILREIEESGTPVHPSWSTIKTIQDKYEQKLHLRERGVAVADALPLSSDSEEELGSVGRQLGYPFMLKSRKDAYDGRGNFPVRSAEDIPAAIEALGKRGANSLYAEKWASFTMELAVMVVQTKDGTLAFPAVETVHENSICKLVYAPARGVSTSTFKAAEGLAKRAVSSFKGKGVYGVEMFLLPNGELLINEIAPRPHNSGHYTIEACPLSQYDAHLRAILDLPIPEDSLRIREPAIMLNILGGPKPDSHINIAKYALNNPRTSIHLYGKGDGSPGRKMGHLTVTAHSMSECETLIAPLIHEVDILSSQIPQSTKFTPTKPSPLVAVIMGSDSDFPTLKPCLDILTTFSIPFTVAITSAHRTPEYMSTFTSTAAQNGIRVIIAAAGGAAHLPGMAAAHTSLPVIGIPIRGSTLDGMDSLLSIVQMPRGVPVATVAINNSLNAGLLAARVLGVTDVRVRERVERYALESREEVRGKGEKLGDLGWEDYLKGMGK
ncbi:phosphoribosylamidoimidazole-succinocarboxamidesynthase [Tothia fuscella]|uniref:Phosphoribosylaminoimidazole carboxylase n=1 Tax=Tothia fuscella TaxID=1048955 RepID=A0A9P4P0W7_9PEZI|nr:phosphoribosylamidoimidazole-succinocarboxamidesynthase [Tothia fuscella]